MSRKQLISLTKIDPKLIEFKLPKKDSGSKGKFFNMLYPDKSGNMTLFNIQLPKLSAPFGVGTFEDKSGSISYSVTLEIPENSKTLATLKEIQKLTLEFVVKNASFFYKKQNERDGVSAYFKEFIRQDDEMKYPPNFTIKLKLKSDSDSEFDINTEIVSIVDSETITDTDQKLFVENIDEIIQNRCELIAVVNPYGYQVDTKYGLTFKCVNARIFTILNEHNTFLDDSESETEVPEIETEVHEPKKNKKKSKKE